MCGAFLCSDKRHESVSGQVGKCGAAALPSYADADPAYFARKWKGRLSTYSRFAGNGPWEYGYALVNDMSKHFAERGYKCDEVHPSLLMLPEVIFYAWMDACKQASMLQSTGGCDTCMLACMHA